jgi:hypothetical protein
VLRRGVGDIDRRLPPPLPLFFVAVFLAEDAAEPREARGVGEGDRPFMRRLLVFFFSMEIFSAQYM